MAERHRSDDLARLRAEFAARLAAQEARSAAQDAAIARLTRRRLPRRALTVFLAALLVALVPLATLAANPFTDLHPGSPHNGNIEAIFAAGITTGCDPGVAYCPSDNVTREEMASFLARAAGLGGNPPVANAATAVTATNAANANALGGQPPGAFLASAGEMTLRYSFLPLTTTFPSTVLTTGGGPVNTVTVTSAGTPIVRLALDRPTRMFGLNLAIKSVQVCYKVTGTPTITAARLTAGESGVGTDLAVDNTPRASATAECFTFGPVSPATASGALFLAVTMSFPSTAGSVALYSATLTLAPTAAGAP